MAKRRKKLSPEQMRKHIHSFCGMFKLKPGGKSAVRELIEENANHISLYVPPQYADEAVSEPALFHLPT